MNDDKRIKEIEAYIKHRQMLDDYWIFSDNYFKRSIAIVAHSLFIWLSLLLTINFLALLFHTFR
jgi:hypothetical protein